MMFLEHKTPLFRRFPKSRMPVDAIVCTLAFVFGCATRWHGSPCDFSPSLSFPAERIRLPLAIALFPQQSTSSVTALEPEFQNLRDKNGQPITELTYNKGL